MCVQMHLRAYKRNYARKIIFINRVKFFEKVVLNLLFVQPQNGLRGEESVALVTTL
jgi:hypothetical protein